MKNGPYELIVAPKGYPGKLYRDRYAYEHHVVYWHKRKKIPKNGEIIHHKNGKKRDNRISNLVLLTSKQHASEHSTAVIFLWNTCGHCLKIYRMAKRNYIFALKRGRKIFFCSRSCSVRRQHMAGKVGIEPTPPD